jgi:hypothetical protein
MELDETFRVIIPIIKLELSASVGFIHKECVTLHGHTILKYEGTIQDIDIRNV